MFEEVMESQIFWICAGLGVGLEIAGWILGKKWTGYALPLWQLIILLVVTVIVSGFFALRE